MHYGVTREVHNVLVRPGCFIEDFKAYWRKQVPYERDGCCSVSVQVDSTDKLTNTRWNRFCKKPNPFIDEWAPSYTCHAVAAGILGWCVQRRVRHIVNHHVEEALETKSYKTRPKHIIKDGTLYAECRYVCTFDARDYDPLEHC